MRPSWKAIAVILLLGPGVGFLACAHQSPAPPPPSYEGADVSKSRQKAVDTAISDLAHQIHSPKADIAAVSQNDTNWEDSCLGCAKAGEKCKHLLTPGYLITLRVRDASYEYHTDRSGHDARLCGQAPVAPPIAAPVPPQPTPIRE
jgi:hypothetical protein